MQTNATISNRLVRSDDGTMSAVWTFSSQTATYSDRGTGYNYYDPNSANLWSNGWFDPITSNGPGLGTITRTESVRTGFTNICVTGSGAELSISHSSTIFPGSIVMHQNRRATKGTGAWTGRALIDTATSGLYYGLWGKAIADGDYVHAIWRASSVDASGAASTAIARNGQTGELLYGRSNDGGATWGILSQGNPLIDSTYNLGFGGDSYSIDAKNGVVAIAYSGISTDVGILKSTDNGNTWTRTVIQQFPIPFFDEAHNLTDINNDGVVDTVDSNGEDAHVLIDDNGMCHVWFSAMRMLNSDTTDGSYSYFPNEDGMYYWNESMGTNNYVLITGVIDANGDGTINLPTSTTCSLLSGYYGGCGLTCMPSAGIDANGTIYLCYQSICEACDTTTFTSGSYQARRHVYVMYSTDHGATWSTPEDIVPTTAQGGSGEGQEAAYGCMARKVDSDIYILYQRDTQPGNSLYTAGTCDEINNHGAGPSDIVVAKIPVSSLVGINNTQKPADFTVSQNYPNPATGETNISVTLAKASSVQFEVTDVVGKVVYSEAYRNFVAGKNNITLNTQGFASGIYNYSVITNDNKVTKQMVVR